MTKRWYIVTEIVERWIEVEAENEDEASRNAAEADWTDWTFEATHQEVDSE